MRNECSFFDSSHGCGLRVVEGIPTEADCDSCPEYQGPPRGLGDQVHRVAKALQIPRVIKAVTDSDCGCQKRRQALNDRFPSKD